MRKAKLIIDLQFGSTGKGLIAGYLAEKDKPDTILTAWSANAGHTYINGTGRKFIHTMLANGIVSPNLKRLMLGPGSIINPDSLLSEIMSVKDILETNPDLKIYIHENAAVIAHRHIEEESGPMTKIGSTKKGCGAAAIQRIRRNPDDNNTVGCLLPFHSVSEYVTILDHIEYGNMLDQSEVIQIEGAQGYSLSMYHGFYPYCTSRDVSTAQILADVGIPIKGWADIEVIGTLRTYPIRVANRFNEEGVMVGWSGPCYYDQHEITFESISQEIELTTVTKLPRRIFTYSWEQIKQAIRQNSVDKVFINFVNYCDDPGYFDSILQSILYSGAGVGYISTGPSKNHVEEVNQNHWVHKRCEAIRI